MYLRTTQRRDKDGSIVRYHALAENVRHPEKGHVEANSFGRADRLDRAALERLVASIRRVLDADGGRPTAGEKGHDRAIEIEASFDLGVAHVVEQLWTRLGIGQAIAARLASGRPRTRPRCWRWRRSASGSKLACHERWLDRIWLPVARDLSLGQLHRALDVLAEHGDAIEEEVFWHSVDLFELDVDLVFYDATTAWFEGDEEDVAAQSWRGLTFEPLRKRGHGKEGRDPVGCGVPTAPHGDPQVIVALAVTRDGMLVDPARRHRRCHDRAADQGRPPPDAARAGAVGRCCRALRQGQSHRARQRRRPLHPGDADRPGEGDQGRGPRALRRDRAQSPGQGGGQGERRRRYILCLNTEAAARQKRHRREILDLLRLELDRLGSDHPKTACRLVSSKRFGPHLSLDHQGRPFIDPAKARRAEQLDGKFVLTTNDDTLSVADIALGYKRMWIIEACFRKLNTTGLGIRPMFHWTPRRIVAHVKLCVLALMVQRAAEIAAEAPWSHLVAILERLEAVRYTCAGQTIVQASRISPELAAILKKLDISKPKPILAVTSTRPGRQKP